MKKIFIFTIMLTAFLLTGCERSETMKDNFSYGDIKDISQPQWDRLAGKRIFFGHQSVGGNIVEGIKDILNADRAIKLEVIESDNPEDLKPGTFEHYEIGKNEDPESKIRAFSELIKHGTGNNSDIAFFKFCFVDINSSTNVERLFLDYKKSMEELKNQYPGVKFVHFTVPLLKQPEKSFKTTINKFLGRGDNFFDSSNNAARNRYNDLIRSAYEGKEPLFDLARLEAVSPEKNLCSFDYKGKHILGLCPEYTNDGGHLNALGRKAVAEQLLVFLARLD